MGMTPYVWEAEVDGHRRARRFGADEGRARRNDARPRSGGGEVEVGMFRGAGQTNTSLYINLVGTLVQVPLSWALGFPLGLGTWGVWAGFPLSFGVKAALSTSVYLSGRWAKPGTDV